MAYRVTFEADTHEELAALAWQVAVGLQPKRPERPSGYLSAEDRVKILPKELCERADWSTRQLSERLGIRPASLPAAVRSWTYRAASAGLRIEQLLTQERQTNSRRNVTIYRLTELGRQVAAGQYMAKARA